jgi:hypothetical protein
MPIWSGPVGIPIGGRDRAGISVCAGYAFHAGYALIPNYQINLNVKSCSFITCSLPMLACESWVYCAVCAAFIHSATILVRCA